MVARVWTILYHAVMDLPLPQDLPAGWVERWQSTLGPDVGPHLHDPDPAFPPLSGREARTRRNRDIVARLLDTLAPIWF